MATVALRALHFGLPLAAAVLVACTPSTEEGLQPVGPPTGPVVDLEVAEERLLRAHPQGLLESRDGGETWAAVLLPASVRAGRITDAAVPAGGEDVLYIAGPGIGVLRSDDGGRSWESLNEELPGTAVTSLATHADQPSTLYAFLEGEGLYRSEDAGRSWKRMDSGPGERVRQFVHSDMEGSMQTGWLFAVTDAGVRRSMDCFCGWRPTGELPIGEVRDVAYHPEEPERVYLATAGGVFGSEDGGESWEKLADGAPVAMALAVDETGALLAAAEDGTVLRSADRGQSWERIGA